MMENSITVKSKVMENSQKTIIYIATKDQSTATLNPPQGN